MASSGEKSNGARGGDELARQNFGSRWPDGFFDPPCTAIALF